MLCGFVQRAQSTLRTYDLLGRYGGEEFLVLASGGAEVSETSLYERLREAVEKNTISTRGADVAVTVSIGVAESDGKDGVDDLLAAVDAALYEAKDGGRNCVCRSGM